MSDSCCIAFVDFPQSLKWVFCIKDFYLLLYLGTYKPIVCWWTGDHRKEIQKCIHILFPSWVPVCVSLQFWSGKVRFLAFSQLLLFFKLPTSPQNYLKRVFYRPTNCACREKKFHGMPFLILESKESLRFFRIFFSW